MSSHLRDRWDLYLWPYLKYVGYELNRRWRFAVARVTRHCPECSLRRTHKMDCGRWRGRWRR